MVSVKATAKCQTCWKSQSQTLVDVAEDVGLPGYYNEKCVVVLQKHNYMAYRIYTYLYTSMSC